MLFSARRDLSARQVGTDLVLYDSAGREVHVLNSTAAKVFELCDGSHTLEEMAKVLTESFDGVDYVQAYEDVKQILNTFEEKCLMVSKD